MNDLNVKKEQKSCVTKPADFNLLIHYVTFKLVVYLIYVPQNMSMFIHETSFQPFSPILSNHFIYPRPQCGGVLDTYPSSDGWLIKFICQRCKDIFMCLKYLLFLIHLKQTQNFI